MRVILVGCGERKRSGSAPAKDLYTSPAFANRRRIAEQEGDRWFILSGLHGLLDPEQITHPYNRDLTDATPIEKRGWASKVVRQLEDEFGPEMSGITFEVLAPSAYCSFGLKDGLSALGAVVEWPVEGMRQFEQGAHYSSRGIDHAPKPDSTKERPVSPTYRPLYEYFQSLEEDTISLSFKKIEEILGKKLPPSARRHAAWWSGSVAPSSWRGAGWTLKKADRAGQVATFAREERTVLRDPQNIIHELAVTQADKGLVREAVMFLSDSANAESAASFPSRGQKLDLPGLYSWWCDEPGMLQLSLGLGSPINRALIYAGQAGADTRADLEQRIIRTHLSGKIARSTFRLTLTAILRAILGLEIVEGELTSQSHQQLTAWMMEHLSVAVFPHEERKSLMAFEAEVIREIDAPLNLKKVIPTPTRAKLKLLRNHIRKVEST